ncbi:MAG: SMI1/KNR4 family protein [Capsulimonadaceae bacterium]
MEDRAPSTAIEWRPFLREFSKEILEEDDRDSSGTRSLSDATHNSGWVGSPPATEKEITDAETRIGMRLPASYHNFLLVSNGWPAVGAGSPDRLLPVDQIDTVPRRDKSLIYYGYPYGSTVKYAIVISGLNCAQGSDGDGVLMLAPTAFGPEGEWQCFDYAPWHPGIDRYGSFGTRMLELRKFVRSQLDKNAVPAEDPDPDKSAGPEPPASD